MPGRDLLQGPEPPVPVEGALTNSLLNFLKSGLTGLVQPFRSAVQCSGRLTLLRTPGPAPEVATKGHT